METLFGGLNVANATLVTHNLHLQRLCGGERLVCDLQSGTTRLAALWREQVCRKPAARAEE